MTEQEHFGLMGLSAIFEARRQFDIGGPVDDTLPPQMSNSILFMGQDLNSLGMDLDSPEPLHPNFHVFPDATGSGSMFDSRSRHPVPAFHVPEAYTVTNVPPMHSRINAFSDGMLAHHISLSHLLTSFQRPCSRSSTLRHAT
jgi:CCR4-NOT transcription complex subunit 2